LQVVIEVRPALTADVRAGVVAMVKAATG